MEAGSEFSSEAEPIDPQRAKWLREALESMTVDLASEMRKRIVTIIQNISSHDFTSVIEETASALDDLIDFTEDMNLADAFLKIGGLELLKALFNLPTSVFSAQTGMLLSNIVQNHEDAQKATIKEGFLEISMQQLLKERDPTNMSGLLSGISSLVRGCALSQKHFVQNKGFENLFVVLEKTCQPNEQDKYERFNQKASFFIFCLCQELYDDQLEALENFGLADRIANLILALNPPFEFFVKALVLLLNGRVSSLINPPPDPAPAPSSLFKLSISEGSQKQLVAWLDSVKSQKDSLLDIETREELAKALL